MQLGCHLVKGHPIISVNHHIRDGQSQLFENRNSLMECAEWIVRIDGFEKISLEIFIIFASEIQMKGIHRLKLQKYGKWKGFTKIIQQSEANLRDRSQNQGSVLITQRVGLSRLKGCPCSRRKLQPEPHRLTDRRDDNGRTKALLSTINKEEKSEQKWKKKNLIHHNIPNLNDLTLCKD